MLANALLALAGVFEEGWVNAKLPSNATRVRFGV
jgi:hypothetical protein